MRQGLCSCYELCNHFTLWKCWPAAPHGHMWDDLYACQLVKTRTSWKNKINTSQEWGSFRQLSPGCVGPWRCSCVSPFTYLRCNRQKMMLKLLCDVLSNLCEKQVVKVAVVCVKALGDVYKSECRNVYVCMYYGCFIL